MTTTPGRRGPYAKSLALRETIAREVLAAVDEQGHESVTSRGVAARLEMPEATVLYHFPSRDHLLVAALQLMDDDAAGGLEGDPPEDLDLDRLMALATEGTGPDRRRRLAVTMRGRSATQGHPAEQYFRRRDARSVDIFAAIIARMQGHGTAHPSLDPRAVAVQITALYEGLASARLLEPSIDVPALLVDAIRRLSGQHVMELHRRFAEDAPDPATGAGGPDDVAPQGSGAPRDA